MDHSDWTLMFPPEFRRNLSFGKLQELVHEISNHKSMKVREKHVLENMIRASLVFTVCFYANLLASLKHIVDEKYKKNPFSVDKDNTLLHLFLELSSGELATNNISNQGYSPHYVPMLNAAKQAGVNTNKIEKFVKHIQTQNVETLCKKLKFSAELTRYLEYSYKCTQNFDTSFATIALREITLPINFNVIHRNLPNDAKYNGYRRFLSAHINLDKGEHGKLMSEALNKTKNRKKILNTMIQFYTFRKQVYNACLSKTPLF